MMKNIWERYLEFIMKVLEPEEKVIPKKGEIKKFYGIKVYCPTK